MLGIDATKGVMSFFTSKDFRHTRAIFLLNELVCFFVSIFAFLCFNFVVAAQVLASFAIVPIVEVVFAPRAVRCPALCALLCQPLDVKPSAAAATSQEFAEQALFDFGGLCFSSRFLLVLGVDVTKGVISFLLF